MSPALEAATATIVPTVSTAARAPGSVQPAAAKTEATPSSVPQAGLIHPDAAGAILKRFFRAEKTISSRKGIWQDDTMNFNVKIMGMSVPGQVRVEESLVWINVTLPAALAMLVGAVRPAIEQASRKALESK